MVSSSDDESSVTAEAAFRIWVNRPRGRTLRDTGAVLKPGPEVMKTVTLGYYGSPTSGEVRNRTLRFRSHDVRANKTPAFDDDWADKNSWFCENEEIERLLAFLHNDVAHTGRYQVVDVDSPTAALLKFLKHNEVDTRCLVDALVRRADVEQIVSFLVDSDLGLSAAQSAVLRRRRELVAELRRLVDSPTSTETQVQSLIGNAYWIFGGRYVGVAERRTLAMLDQTDIPLMGSDGTLHIVELKGPSIERLIIRQRNHWIPGPEVHLATSQALNYLRSLDEQGAGLTTMYRNELGQNYDMSRLFATVVIGHSDHQRPAEVEREVVARTLRQYNANLSRVEVITYDQLVESAERALAFESDSKNAPPPEPLHLPPAPAMYDDPRGSLPLAVSPWDDEPPF